MQITIFKIDQLMIYGLNLKDSLFCIAYKLNKMKSSEVIKYTQYVKNIYKTTNKMTTWK